MLNKRWITGLAQWPESTFQDLGVYHLHKVVHAGAEILHSSAHEPEAFSVLNMLSSTASITELVIPPFRLKGLASLPEHTRIEQCSQTSGRSAKSSRFCVRPCADCGEAAAAK